VAKMAEGNKVCFASRDEAIGQGYRPCKRCNP
jgi:methylphosphotriester-DNA--protein-cysteine methyltransferase